MSSLAVFGISSDGLNLVVSLLVLFLVVFWLALVYWTYADARRRIEDPMLVGCATAAALFPFAGTIVYMIVRPPENIEDRRERELDIAAAEARLASIEHLSCPYCAFDIERSFLRCPSCLRRLKEPCRTCGKPLDPRWKICPYCEADIGQAAPQPRRRERPRRERPAAAAEPAAPRKAATSEAGRKVAAEPGARRQAAAGSSGERRVAAGSDGERQVPAEAPGRMPAGSETQRQAGAASAGRRQAAPGSGQRKAPAPRPAGAPARASREKSRSRPSGTADGAESQPASDGAQQQRPGQNNRQKRSRTPAGDESASDAATAEQQAVRPRTRPPSAG